MNSHVLTITSRDVTLAKQCLDVCLSTKRTLIALSFNQRRFIFGLASTDSQLNKLKARISGITSMRLMNKRLEVAGDQSGIEESISLTLTTWHLMGNRN